MASHLRAHRQFLFVPVRRRQGSNALRLYLRHPRFTHWLLELLDNFAWRIPAS